MKTKKDRKTQYQEMMDDLKKRKAAGTLSKAGEFILSGKGCFRIKDMRAVLK